MFKNLENILGWIGAFFMIILLIFIFFQSKKINVWE